MSGLSRIERGEYLFRAAAARERGDLLDAERFEHMAAEGMDQDAVMERVDCRRNMKVTIGQKAFRVAVELAWQGRASRSALPVLKDIRLETKDGHLDVSATNLETYVVASCEANVETIGGTIADGTGLMAAVKGMKGIVTLELTPSGLAVSDGAVSAVLNTTRLEEWPHVPTWSGTMLTFTSLSEALGRVVHAAAKDDIRPVLNAVLVEAKDGIASVVAADSYRLAIMSIPVTGEGSVLIPSASVKAMVKANVNRLIIGDVLVCGEGDAMVYAKIVHGSYPDYERILRTGNLVTTTINGTELRKACQRFATLKPANIRIHVLMDAIVLSASGMEVRVPAISDGTIEVGADPRFIADACLDGELIMRLTSKATPIVLSKDNYTALVMPFWA